MVGSRYWLVRRGLRGIFAKDVGERGCEQFRIGRGEDERRTELDDVVVRTIGAGEDTAFSQAVHDVRGLFGRGRAACSVIDQIEPEK